MDMARFYTNWIWVPGWSLTDDSECRIVYFRKEFLIQEVPPEYTIRISADSCYKLYVNGRFAQKGPQKAINLSEWYVDIVDIAPLLRQGKNAVSVEVLRFSAHTNASILRTDTPMLYIEDCCQASSVSLNGKAGWKCCINREITLLGETGIGPAPIHVQEDVCASDAFAYWKLPGYDDSAWQTAVAKFILDIDLSEAPFHLIPRTIPFMEFEEKRFQDVSAVRVGEEKTSLKKTWLSLIQFVKPLTIPANTVQIVELSTGEEECGYLKYVFAGGSGAKVATLCAECYAYPQPDQPSPMGGITAVAPKKGDRTDSIHGTLIGHTSCYTAAGYGTPAAPETYEPFWFRTFRYVQIRIETADVPLTLLDLSYRATGYPLIVKTTFHTSDPEIQSIWDISVRTLRRCMHETYMDCPFYEQLQYAMDARSEILFTYAVSADDQLARQTMEAFRCAQRPDGLLSASAPHVGGGVIPGFCIYYILMVHDHMLYFGDHALIRRHLPAIDRILSFFDEHVNGQGLVSKVGGRLFRQPFWSFIDWAAKWDSGVPGAADQGTGALTAESLLYLYGLECAAELTDYVGRQGVGDEYRARAARLKAAIRSQCMGAMKEQALIQDGPGIEEYSVHCQALAVLTGVVSSEEGWAMLNLTLHHHDCAQPTVAFMFYVFRALEMCRHYKKTKALWEPWRKMLRQHLTTCVENDTDMRSDCHAWGSLMCYELPSAILGVRPAAPGFEQISVTPQTDMVHAARGSVVTPRGIVQVEWEKSSDHACIPKWTLNPLNE